MRKRADVVSGMSRAYKSSINGVSTEPSSLQGLIDGAFKSAGVPKPSLPISPSLESSYRKLLAKDAKVRLNRDPDLTESRFPVCWAAKS